MLMSRLVINETQINIGKIFKANDFKAMTRGSSTQKI